MSEFTLITEGRKRYYIENLEKRDMLLEGSSPYKITINGEVIEEHSWGVMLQRVAALLYSKNPLPTEKLLSFRADWSKKPIFATKPGKNAWKEISVGLYVNCLHSAIHSCWYLAEIIRLFGVSLSEVKLVIHRTPSIEPKEVRDRLEAEYVEGFTSYMVDEKSMDKCEADRVINYIKEKLNHELFLLSKNYNNFFLFDEYNYLYNYVDKINKKRKEIFAPTKAEKEYLEKVFLLLLEYDKTVESSYK